jgi:hypothetical protein
MCFGQFEQLLQVVAPLDSSEILAQAVAAGLASPWSHVNSNRGGRAVLMQSRSLFFIYIPLLCTTLLS